MATEFKKVKLMTQNFGEVGISMLALFRSTYFSGIRGNRERMSADVDTDKRYRYR